MKVNSKKKQLKIAENGERVLLITNLVQVFDFLK